LPKRPPRDPATREALRRIEAVRKTDATLLDLSNLKLIALPEAIGRLTALTKLWLKNN
jgi:Leucine-rich repeat (LRR) protein